MQFGIFWDLLPGLSTTWLSLSTWKTLRAMYSRQSDGRALKGAVRLTEVFSRCLCLLVYKILELPILLSSNRILTTGLAYSSQVWGSVVLNWMHPLTYKNVPAKEKDHKRLLPFNFLLCTVWKKKSFKFFHPLANPCSHFITSHSSFLQYFWLTMSLCIRLIKVTLGTSAKL